MTRKGVWGIQGVRDKYLQSLWVDSYNAFGWGHNEEGEAGTAPWNQDQSSPTTIGETSGVALAKLGTAGTGGILIESSGKMRAWGKNSYGQLGFNDKSDRNGAYPIPGTTVQWDDVSVGGKDANCDYVLATRLDGTLWAWGRNQSGQLGQNEAGNPAQYSSPVQVGTETTWGGPRAMAVAQNAVAVIKSDGTLWSWGYNGRSNLGHNSQTNRSSPVQVPGTTWSNVSMGFGMTLATRTDGTLWTWGLAAGNTRLGLGNANSYSSPKQIGTDTDWKTGMGGITTNGNVSAAVKTSGELYIWGKNEGGQLGLNQATNYPNETLLQAPTQLPGSWSKAFQGYYHFLAIKGDGTLWSWGYGTKGQLGGGFKEHKSSPVQASAETDWHQAMGVVTQTSCGLRANLTPAQL